MKNRLSSNQKRDISIDLVKVIAIIGVVIIHTCVFDTPVSSPNWLFSLSWRSISGASVPLFLMASGAVMLDPSKELSLKKLYFKNILRIIIAMVVWGTVYKAYHLLQAENLSVATLANGIKEVLLFNQEFHFYYLHMILIVYAFLPLTRVLTNNSTKKQLRYILLLWFVFAVVHPTILHFYPFNRFEGMTIQWGINLTYASIGFGLLGYYLKKYPVGIIKALLFVFIGFTLIFVLTLHKSKSTGILYEHFLNGNSVPVCILATGIFALAKNINIKSKKLQSMILWLSKSSFCIYLVHMLLMYIMKGKGITIAFAPYIISIPLFAILNIILCITIYFILSKIPFINKWLI